MTEAYLHYIWKHQLFKIQNLTTIDGESIAILNKGIHNVNAGPDFLEARIKIGDKEWAGQVEIHIRSSDWIKHNHQVDKAYNNVVLHVVYEHDSAVFRQDSSQIPTLELKGKFDEMGYWRYEQFVGTQRFLACGLQVKGVDELLLNSMLDRVLIERIEEKAEWVAQVFESAKKDWSETFYRMLFYAFGLKINADTMLVLAEQVPLRILRKHKGSHLQIEALLMGMAGFLDGEDEYQQTLKKEFQHLQAKYSLHPLGKEMWKFFNLRPISFPTVRLAQLAAILVKTPDLFREAIMLNSPLKVLDLFQVDTSTYWQTHYTFGKRSPKRDKDVSQNLANQILINAIVPVLFYYSSLKGNEESRLKIIDWLSAVKSEANSITKHFKEAGFKNKSGYDSQAILQLYKGYCRQRKCLSCAIGVKLLKQ